MSTSYLVVTIAAAAVYAYAAYVDFARADTARFEVMFAGGIDKERHPELLECAGQVQSRLEDALRELAGDDPVELTRRAAELWSIAHGEAVNPQFQQGFYDAVATYVRSRDADAFRSTLIEAMRRQPPAK